MMSNSPSQNGTDSIGKDSKNNIETDIGKISLASEPINNPTGFSIPELYKFSLTFFKEKAGKALHVTYEDKNKLVALISQINNGPFDASTAEPLGTFDMIGKDRRLAWQKLGNINKEDAMNQFIGFLHDLTPTFMPYIEAVWADHLETQRLAKEAEERKKQEEEDLKQLEEEKLKEEEELVRQEETKRQIQEALNQQTFTQFKQYAEQQYPANPEEQAVLIKQLQEQHYLQYMQQVYNQPGLMQHCQQVSTNTENDEVLEGEENEEEQEVSSHSDEDDHVEAASMWTRRDIKEFKESIKLEGPEAVIKVGHGETVTIRVPTHEDGSSLFWEFATDFFDIAFGVSFEWTNDTSSVVSIHISESDDEEDEEEEEQIIADDVERLAETKPNKKPPTSVIIPVYRRDCHEEVYAGSHRYPGRGVYLLKFDNSYSLWRSKKLYYRVYYTSGKRNGELKHL